MGLKGLVTTYEWAIISGADVPAYQEILEPNRVWHTRLPQLHILSIFVEKLDMYLYLWVCKQQPM